MQECNVLNLELIDSDTDEILGYIDMKGSWAINNILRTMMDNETIGKYKNLIAVPVGYYEDTGEVYYAIFNGIKFVRHILFKSYNR